MKSLLKIILSIIGSGISLAIQNRIFFNQYNYIYEHSSHQVVKLLVRYVRLPSKTNYWTIWLLNGKKVRTKIYANNIKTAQFALSYKWHSPSINFTEKLLNVYYTNDIPWIDVGANLGLRSLLALSNKRPVYFIEPNSELNGLNIERCKSNGFDNYHLFEIGASDETGTVEFFIDKSSYNSSIETDQFPEDSIDHKEFIKIDTIDNIFQNSSDCVRTACIKIDVEGHELHVIEGARKFIKSYYPTMIIEVNEKGSHLVEFVNIIKGLGYDIFEIGEFGKKKYFKKIPDDLSLNRASIIYNDFLVIKDKALLNSLMRYTVN